MNYDVCIPRWRILVPRPENGDLGRPSDSMPMLLILNFILMFLVAGSWKAIGNSLFRARAGPRILTHLLEARRSTSSEVSGDSVQRPLAKSDSAGDGAVAGTGAVSYKRGQSIAVRILQFGPLGASVSVDDGKAFGLVLQREIALLRDKRGADVELGETIPAFVEKVRDDSRLNVSLRPVDISRMKDTASQVLEALEGSPSLSIPVGDKSSPEDVAAYFYGVTKLDFKKAVGMLYKEGVVKPGPFTTELIPEENRSAVGDRTTVVMHKSPLVSKALTAQGAKLQPTTPNAVPDWAKAVASDSDNVAKGDSKSDSKLKKVEKTERVERTEIKSVDTAPRVAKIERVAKGKGEPAERLGQEDRGSERQALRDRGELRKTIFVGNLPISSCTEDTLLSAFSAKIDTGRIKLPVRIPVNEEGDPRGFAYVEFLEDEDVERALFGLKGLKIGSRVARFDYADSEAKDRARERSSSGPGSPTVGDLLGIGQGPAAKSPSAPNANLPPAAATLFVGNLPYAAGVLEITQFLEACAGVGSVRSVRLASDPVTGRKKGFAFVDFYDEEKAKGCFFELHEKQFMGRAVIIDDATRRD